MLTLKEELENYLSEFKLGYNDRWACRYLAEYQHNKTLWKEIIKVTNFLSNTARPKQRVWHIINDVYKIPTCPVSGKRVRWYDNRYLTYFSSKEKYKDPNFHKKMVDTYESKTGYKHNSQNPKVKKRKKKTFKKNKNAGKHKPITISEAKKKERSEKTKITWQNKYGVDNIFQLPKVIDSIRDKRYISNYGKTYNEMITDFGIYNKDIYYMLVSEYTELSWSKHFNEINPNRLNRAYKEWHLDHIFSKCEGLKNMIPPEIVGHWTNLQMLWHMDNDLKATRCDKTIEQLYEDYFREENIPVSFLFEGQKDQQNK